MIYIAIMVIILLIDTWIKEYVEENKKFGEKEKLFGGKITIEKYHNTGAMLNFMEKKSNAVKLVSGTMIGIFLVFFGVLLAKKGNRLLKLGFSMILGGALSNFADRITKGHVTDYIRFSFLKKIIFNVSDLCIFLGSFIILLRTLGTREE